MATIPLVELRLLWHRQGHAARRFVVQLLAKFVRNHVSLLTSAVSVTNVVHPEDRPTSFTDEIKIGFIKFDNGSCIRAFSAHPQAMAAMSAWTSSPNTPMPVCS